MLIIHKYLLFTNSFQFFYFLISSLSYSHTPHTPQYVLLRGIEHDYPSLTIEQVNNNKEGGKEEGGINESFNPFQLKYLQMICGK